jgi:hypothetical protein
MKFNVQYSTMSPVLPFDIIVLIIDNVGENKDTNLLKELALVSHSFHQICSKHLFATVELHDAVPKRRVASSKKEFVKLLKRRPDIVKYIRKLTYKTENNNNGFQSPTSSSFVNDDHLLSPILPNFLRTISRLNCLAIKASKLDWNTLDSSLTSAFLHLMHLPTINHLSFIKNFPLSSLSSSVNLHRLNILYLRCFNPLQEDGSREIVVDWEMLPKIREFHTSVLQRSCYMLKGKMDDQVSTSWILDDSRCLSPGPKMNGIFDLYCRLPSYLKNSIY